MKGLPRPLLQSLRRLSARPSRLPRPVKSPLKRKGLFSSEEMRALPNVVVGVPLCKSLDLAHLSDIIGGSSFATGAKMVRYLDGSMRDSLHVCPLDPEEGRGLDEAFVFSDGVAVFWEMRRHHRAELLAAAESCVLAVEDSHSRWAHIVDEETEFVEFQRAPASQHRGDFLVQPRDADTPSSSEEEPRCGARTLGDRFVLSSLHFGPDRYSTEAVLERFVLAHAVAVSVKLGTWERLYHDANAANKYRMMSLKRGYVSPKHSEIISAIGLFYDLRNSVNVGTPLMSEPDLLWERSDLATLHEDVYELHLSFEIAQPATQRLIRYFELGPRKATLNYHLESTIDFLQLLDSLDTNRRSHNLEWIIIALIAIEIGIALWEHNWKRGHHPTPQS